MNETTQETLLTQDPPETPKDGETTPNPSLEKLEDGEQEASLLNEDGDEGKKPEDAEKPAGAPEKYEAFKAPESWTEKGLKLDEKVIEKFTPIAKALKLDQAGAQSLIDFYAGVADEHSTRMEEASIQAVKDQRKEWRDEVKADKQVGHRLPEVKQNFTKMLNAVGDEALAKDFKKVMDLTGAGDHPAFIRLMDKLSQRFTEGTFVAGKGPSPAGQLGPGSKPESAAKAMYPTLG